MIATLLVLGIVAVVLKRTSQVKTEQPRTYVDAEGRLVVSGIGGSTPIILSVPTKSVGVSIATYTNPTYEDSLADQHHQPDVAGLREEFNC